MLFLKLMGSVNKIQYNTILTAFIIPHVRILLSYWMRAMCHSLLATCATVGSLTAVTIQRFSTRCQGDDVLGLFGILKQIWYPSMVSTVNLLLRYCTAWVSFVSFNLLWILGARGEVGGGGGMRYNKTNMTSLWGCQHDSLPFVSIVAMLTHIGNPTGMSYLYIRVTAWYGRQLSLKIYVQLKYTVLLRSSYYSNCQFRLLHHNTLPVQDSHCMNIWWYWVNQQVN